MHRGTLVLEVAVRGVRYTQSGTGPLPGKPEPEVSGEPGRAVQVPQVLAAAVGRVRAQGNERPI